MLSLPTVLLLHETRAGTHHDWLIADPARPGDRSAPLWTVRVGPASWAWREARRLRLTPLPPHRRHYLRHQGPIGDGRGTVRRVDAGWAAAPLWTPERIVLDVAMRGFAGRMELRRRSATLWDAIVF